MFFLPFYQQLLLQQEPEFFAVLLLLLSAWKDVGLLSLLGH